MPWGPTYPLGHASLAWACLGLQVRGTEEPSGKAEGARKGMPDQRAELWGHRRRRHERRVMSTSRCGVRWEAGDTQQTPRALSLQTPALLTQRTGVLSALMQGLLVPLALMSTPTRHRLGRPVLRLGGRPGGSSLRVPGTHLRGCPHLRTCPVPVGAGACRYPGNWVLSTSRGPVPPQAVDLGNVGWLIFMTTQLSGEPGSCLAGSKNESCAQRRASKAIEVC